VLITFSPTAIQTYSGTITVYNNIDQVNNTLAISGTGIEAAAMGLSGNLNFGDVFVDRPVTSTLYITNNANATLNVSSISLPTGFTADWQNGSISGNSNQEVTITFTPIAIQSYSGTITVFNDIDQVNNTIAISGNGIEAPDLEIRGESDFGDIVVNTSDTKTITLKNNSISIINVSSISLPDGFSTDWSSGIIPFGGTRDLIITFTPTEIAEYSGTLTIVNDVDQINNSMTLNGNGTESNYVYPSGGAYGANVLNIDNPNITSGNFSMHAIIPEGKSLRVKISGSFAYVLNHPTDTDWTWVQSGGGTELTVDFSSTHSGVVDFHLLINSAGVAIEVYENGDVTPTWTR
jgi:hypothetical protein